MPAVMVSTAMQGGCTCENACGLRIGTGNVEIAGLFAPKPLGLTAANDWTKEMQTKGFPELQQLYQTLGAPDNLMLMAALQFGHNYNLVSRRAMYGWFNRHLQLGAAEPIAERDYQRLTREEMTVWDASHPKPAGGADFERKLLRWWKEDADRQLAELTPTDAASLSHFQTKIGQALAVIIGQGLPSEQLEFAGTVEPARGPYQSVRGLLQNPARGHQLPLLVLQPPAAGAGANWTVLWLNRDGKSGLLEADGTPRAEVCRLLESGATVMGVDLLYQGDFLTEGQKLEKRPASRTLGRRRPTHAATTRPSSPVARGTC